MITLVIEDLQSEDLIEGNNGNAFRVAHSIDKGLTLCSDNEYVLRTRYELIYPKLVLKNIFKKDLQITTKEFQNLPIKNKNFHHELHQNHQNAYDFDGHHHHQITFSTNTSNEDQDYFTRKCFKFSYSTNKITDDR